MGFGEAFVDQLLSDLATTAAATADTTNLFEMRELVRTAIHCFDDLRIGDGSAKANEHETDSRWLLAPVPNMPGAGMAAF